ncbi:hypothetical protein EV421DRAFT_2034744 [Armillaria borealis]|uniref:Uncharacterized protein n=1 Tax=Armillaria borealis TaxID=47425 RepID=A0AA39JLI9_9AGAR|nr:hypothetical protein EV421DRAFT_2034744 [Armillaria borealis]
MSSNVKIFEAVHPADAVTDSAEMKKILLQIIPLEKLERELATQYGMVQDFDSVEVFGQAKRLAFANPDHDFVENLQDLDRLNDLRLRLTELRYSHTVSPPADD